MTGLSTPDLALNVIEAEPSTLEKATIRVLGYVPGLRGLAPSRRAIKALRGSTWTVVGYGASQVLRSITQLFLAHMLLDPAAFGLVALASVFLSGLDMLSDLGIGMDVVQHRRGDDPVFINTAFLIQVVRGTVLFGVAAALASPFAHFYHQPAVRALIVVAAMSTWVRGFSSGSVWTMTRHVEIRRLTILTVASEVAGVVVSLAWVAASPTAWALVVGRVATGVAFTVGSHLLSKQRVTLDWDSSAARDILMFGTGIFLSTGTYFLSGEAERLVIGKFISVAELGCFSLALTIAGAPSRALQQVVGQVFFPMIASSVRGDPEIAAKHFRSTRWAFLAISTLLGVVFIAYGHRLVAILLPSRYAMTGWMLQLLGFRAAQEVFAAPTSSLILAYGNSRYAAAANGLRLVLMVAGVWLAFDKFGIRGGVAVLAFVPAITYLVLLPAIARYLPRAFRTELLTLGLFVGAMVLAAILPWPWA